MSCLRFDVLYTLQICNSVRKATLRPLSAPVVSLSCVTRTPFPAQQRWQVFRAGAIEYRANISTQCVNERQREKEKRSENTPENSSSMLFQDDDLLFICFLLLLLLLFPLVSFLLLFLLLLSSSSVKARVDTWKVAREFQNKQIKRRGIQQRQ